MPTRAVLATLRRVDRAATDGMREAVATAAAAVADRGEIDRGLALAFLRRMLPPRADGRALSATAVRAVKGIFLI